MRIVHTSDWHLGRNFGAFSLSADQEAFTDWFVGLVRDQRADLVVIAGDIYDRAIAPKDSIELFRTTVRRLLDTGAVVAAITGNHDGAERVSPYDDLLDRSGLIVRGGYEGVGRVVRHTFADGPLDLVLLPFLEPQAAPDGFGADEPGGADEHVSGDSADQPTDDLLERRRRRTHHSVLRTAARHARGQLSAPRSVVVAHAFVTGGTPSESERHLVVGGTGEVDAVLFEGFSYVALGHLHRPQTVGGDIVRYSGTPLPYSFSEDHAKSVAVIELDAAGVAAISTVAVDVGRAVSTITGEMAELLDPNRHRPAQGHFVRAVVTDRETVHDAKARLSAVYPFVAEIRLVPAGVGQGLVDVPVLDVRDIAPLEATRLFWAEAEGSPPDEATDQLLVEAVAAATAMTEGPS